MSDICLVATLCKETRVIGNDGRLPWPKLPSDRQRFADTTEGRPVIMGRKTWDSTPLHNRPLPNCTNFIISRQPHFSAEQAEVFPSVGYAIRRARRAKGGDVVVGIGGGELYDIMILYATTLRLTLIHNNFSGNVRFPEFASRFRCTYLSGEYTEKGVTFYFGDFERR